MVALHRVSNGLFDENEILYKSLFISEELIASEKAYKQEAELRLAADAARRLVCTFAIIRS